MRAGSIVGLRPADLLSPFRQGVPFHRRLQKDPLLMNPHRPPLGHMASAPRIRALQARGYSLTDLLASLALVAVLAACVAE